MCNDFWSPDSLKFVDEFSDNFPAMTRLPLVLHGIWQQGLSIKIPCAACAIRLAVAT
jgi:hypothetical protein